MDFGSRRLLCGLCLDKGRLVRSGLVGRRVGLVRRRLVGRGLVLCGLVLRSGLGLVLSSLSLSVLLCASLGLGLLHVVGDHRADDKQSNDSDHYSDDGTGVKTVATDGNTASTFRSDRGDQQLDQEEEDKRVGGHSDLHVEVRFNFLRLR
ncbi:hypothetical protein BJ742DRAFT_841772 [Cladochytrium replicatum]|nr:hypothetical protein BJ742DRAFT_841772 [Cladochytrium replicatum]